MIRTVPSEHCGHIPRKKMADFNYLNDDLFLLADEILESLTPLAIPASLVWKKSGAIQMSEAVSFCGMFRMFTFFEIGFFTSVWRSFLFSVVLTRAQVRASQLVDSSLLLLFVRRNVSCSSLFAGHLLITSFLAGCRAVGNHSKSLQRCQQIKLFFCEVRAGFYNWISQWRVKAKYDTLQWMAIWKIHFRVSTTFPSTLLGGIDDQYMFFACMARYTG